MAYLGNTPTTQSFISGTDYFNGDGATIAFTLSRAVVSVNDIEAVVNNVVQQPNTAYTVSGTTITFTSAPSAGTGNIYVRYLSTTTQSITPSQNTVSYSTLNSDNQSKLGISFKNRIINGAMTIDQRNAGASISVSTDGVYPVDRFRAGNGGGGSGVFSAQQSTTAPAGFYNSLALTVTTADASIASTDWYYFRQWIEQANVADLNWGTANAQTVTLSFWVRSSVTGTYGACVNNSDYGYDYAFSYTINAANTWEYKTVTITGLTAGTVAAYNGRGFGVSWALGAGSNYTTSTVNSWYAGGATYVPTGSTNWISNASATFYITGVQLEVGTQATTFDYRSIGTELALCQRYYEKFFNQATAPVNGVASGNGAFNSVALSAGDIRVTPIYFKVVKRTSPTITYYNTDVGSGSNWAYFTGSWNTNSSTATETSGENAFTVICGVSGRTFGQALYMSGNWTASAEL